MGVDVLFHEFPVGAGVGGETAIPAQPTFCESLETALTGIPEVLRFPDLDYFVEKVHVVHLNLGIHQRKLPSFLPIGVLTFFLQ